MLIIPAIDLKDAKVVRLYQGKGQERTLSWRIHSRAQDA